MFSFQNGDGEVEGGGGSSGKSSVVAVDHEDFEINLDGQSTHTHSRTYSEDRKKNTGAWNARSTVLPEHLVGLSGVFIIYFILFNFFRQLSVFNNKGCEYEEL